VTKPEAALSGGHEHTVGSSICKRVWVKHGIAATAAFCQQANVRSFERKSWLAINLYYTQSPGRVHA
jgi:hypothetical protein